MSETELIQQNQGLVHHVVRSFSYLCGGMIGYDDLMSEGNIALLRAIRTYNAEHTSGAKFSTYAIVCIYYAMLKIAYAQRLKKNTGIVISLDAPISDDEDFTLADIFGTEDVQYQTIIAKDRWERISANMDSRLKEAFYLYYGQDMTLEQIASRFGVSKQTISNRIETADRILRERADIIQNGLPKIRSGAILKDGLPVEEWWRRNNF